MLSISKMIWPSDEFHAFEMGAMFSARFWIDGTMALIWGRLIDKFNRKRIFILGTLATGSLVFINIFAPVGGGTSNYISWLLIRILIGIFMSQGGPAIHSLANDLLNKGEKSQFFGSLWIFWIIFQNIGMIVSSLMFQTGYWRYYFMISALLYFITAGMFSWKIKEPKRGIQEPILTHILSTTDAVYDYQLNRQTTKSILFSKSNILIVLEGFSTNLIFGIIDLIVLPFMQTSPRNISPSSSALLQILFSVPGSIIGIIFLAKLSDRLGKKNIKNRIRLILFAVITSISISFAIFSIRWPSLTPQEGTNFSFIANYPIFFLIGAMFFTNSAIIGLYGLNQPPIIQELNLPESQGTMRGWNQFIEVFSYGSGPIIGGLLLQFVGQNYQATIQLILLFTIPGILMWIVVHRIIDKDLKKVQDILSLRLKEIEKQPRLQNN